MGKLKLSNLAFKAHHNMAPTHFSSLVLEAQSTNNSYSGLHLEFLYVILKLQDLPQTLSLTPKNLSFP